MNLYELQKQYKTEQASLRYYKEKLKTLENELIGLKSPQFQEDRVQGNPRRRTINDVVADKIQIEYQITTILENIANLDVYVKEVEEILKEFNDTEQLIYFEYHIKGYTAEKIGQRYHYSARQIYRIVNKVEERLSVSRNVIADMK